MPLRSRAFLVSTKLPTCTPSSSTVPGRSRANGPTWHFGPTIASSITEYGFTSAPSPTVVCVSTEPWPMITLAPISQSP